MLLTRTQKVTLTVVYEDDSVPPKEVGVDGAPVWSSSDPKVIEVTPATDGLSAVARATGKDGAALVQSKADADLDSGEERELIATIDFDVRAKEAVGARIVAGTPEEQ